MVTFYLKIKGKEVLTTKDVLFILTSGFILGFSVALGIYTGNIPLSVFLIFVSWTLLTIYILRLIKVWEEIAHDVNSSYGAKDVKNDSKKVINIEPKKFFEA